MTKHEVLELEAMIMKTYPKFKQLTKDQLVYWHEQLKDYPLQAAKENLEYHKKFERTQITLSDLLRYGPETNEDLKKLFINYKGVK